MRATSLEPRTAEAESGWGADRAEWHPAHRLAFRFLCAYLVLYIAPFPLNFVPLGEMVARYYEKFWNALVPWVGKRAFGLEIVVLPNGSGDTTYNYVQVGCFLALAGVVAVVWSLLDRRAVRYERVHAWVRLYVRFSLATTLISYGAVKVIKSQFPGPSLDRLLQPYGDSSPMGLLWTFMGASTGYNVFTGASEMLGGLLLTTRRTTLLGALVSIGVLANVATLNFCYDVPVKLFSLNLLAMAVFLAAPDLGRLVDIFLRNRGTSPSLDRSIFSRTILDRGGIVFRTLFVVGFSCLTLFGAHSGRRVYGDLAPKPPLYGIWAVEEFRIGGEVRPPMVNDPQRWRRVVFDYPGVIAIQLMSDTRKRYVLALDPGRKSMALTRRDAPSWKSALSFRQPEARRLVLEGEFDGKPILAELRRVDESSFLLLNRGFHWVNEYPFNR